MNNAVHKLEFIDPVVIGVGLVDLCDHKPGRVKSNVKVVNLQYLDRKRNWGLTLKQFVSF